ncbi:UDP-N-acetyl-D-glucosamine 2-epimerase, UDP-hydrolysing [Pseudoalteromonas luteoviolacea]|uniref:UDP-N-acetyl-D-glucosamine 2-epimerase, UDP-hydrolysing n=1 Tax=Pseudoalteromonas luteoviolacea TaxID=43657 RepID=A0A1C0TMZ2_9GAMM|nr:UDP-N-acetylglucosamine 2-epimerase [Pseudoalteromonas luteoviolacea]OCQ20192.1 UDP-N-acetyl-D-glucosamine 2-epimerase, UDP-hydrolysing [Pseudoalteromonas luteoviolacea]
MKKILFLTGTRADFGKLKSLIKKVESSQHEAYVFVTGMHMIEKYGSTVLEVEKSVESSIYKFINQNPHDTMDIVLSKTTAGLSDYVKGIKPDLIVVHGDRVEALAGALVGALNNILVAHIEGGEVSGTIDELIRHSVSKMAHIHFVCNDDARQRLLQLGECEDSIFVIGSPDLDIMNSATLPDIQLVKEHYELPFDNYSILLFHPVTTELDSLTQQAEALADAAIESGRNFVVIYPNNDHGNEMILSAFSKFENNAQFAVFPSVRFEYFLTLLKNADCMIGNSSAGVREAPFYGLPSIDIGSRQKNRSSAKSIVNVEPVKSDILDAFKKVESMKCDATREFGEGKSDEKFIDALNSNSLWKLPKQKMFIDRG